MKVEAVERKSIFDFAEQLKNLPRAEWA